MFSGQSRGRISGYCCTFFFLFQVPSITMAMYSVACSAASLGFIQATLEPHMRSFNMTPLIIGSMFVVSGGCYGFSAPLWGMICDKYPPKMVTLVGKDIFC